MRGLARALWVFLLLLGLLFLGQGVGLVPGSFMTGRIEWAVLGGLLAGAAAVFLWSTTRRSA